MKKFLTTVPGDSVATDSPNTYNQLLARFEQADTTLTPWECAEIYYGFARQSNYKGLVGNGESEAHKLLQLGKYQEAFDQAKSILHECPTSLGAHEILLAVSDVCRRSLIGNVSECYCKVSGLPATDEQRKRLLKYSEYRMNMLFCAY